MLLTAIYCPEHGDVAGELTPPAGPARCHAIVTWPGGVRTEALTHCTHYVELCARCGLRTRWDGGPCTACLELPG